MKEIWSNQICRKHCIHPQIWTCVGLLLPPSHISRVWLCATPETAAHQVPRPRDSPGKNTGVGCHFLLQCMKVKSLSRVQLLVIPWTAAHQAPPSMGFSRQEYWSGVPWPVWGTHLNCSAWETGFPGSPSLVLGTVPQLVAVEERLDLSTEVWLTVRF